MRVRIVLSFAAALILLGACVADQNRVTVSSTNTKKSKIGLLPLVSCLDYMASAQVAAGFPPSDVIDNAIPFCADEFDAYVGLVVTKVKNRNGIGALRAESVDSIRAEVLKNIRARMEPIYVELSKEEG